MKTIKIIIVFSFVFFWGIQIANSQNLTYSELMRLSKIQRWSEIEKFLSTRKYKYAGSIERDDHRTVTWTYNCPDLIFTEKGFNFSYHIGKNRSVVSIQDYEDGQKCYEYIFPSNEAYNLFLRTAPKNNFIFYEDGINDDEIFETYIRIKQNRTEYLTFRKNKDDMLVVFYEP